MPASTKPSARAAIACASAPQAQKRSPPDVCQHRSRKDCLRMTSQRVLIVEDDRVSLTILNRTLSRRGYDVRAVSSVAEARREMAARPIDLLLLDIFMP